jgi:hypothetical protein
MPLIIAIVGFQVLCVVHAVRTGRTQPWLFVIVLLPLIGSLAYFIVEMLPEVANTRRARKVYDNVQTAIDPDREYRERKQQVEISGTPAAKAALAEECVRKGMFDDAAELYRSALTGMYADDPTLLLGYAKVLSEKGEFAGAQVALDHLREKNPEFQSSDGHLLYARTLEGQGKNDEAMSEYEAVAAYFPATRSAHGR